MSIIYNTQEEVEKIVAEVYQMVEEADNKKIIDIQTVKEKVDKHIHFMFPSKLCRIKRWWVRK